MDDALASCRGGVLECYSIRDEACSNVTAKMTECGQSASEGERRRERKRRRGTERCGDEEM